MTLSIKSLQNASAFMMNTGCGELKIWALTTKVLQRYVDDRFLFDWDERRRLIEFISSVTTRINPDDRMERGSTLSADALKCLTEEDLHQFAGLFLQHHPELYIDDDAKRVTKSENQDYAQVEIPIRPEENMGAYLLRLLEEYPRRTSDRLMKSFSELTKASLAENDRISRQLRASLDVVRPSTEQILIRDRTTQISEPLKILAELNEQSVDLISNLNEVVKSLAIDLAANAQETQRSTNVAVSIAKWSLIVAAISFVATMIFSILSYAK